MATTLGKMNVKFGGLSDKGDLLFVVEPESKYNAKYCASKMGELIKKDKDLFVVTVTQKQNSRSNNQNSLMWALLEIMASEMSERRTGQVQAEDCYVDMLELTGAKYEYFQCTKEAYDSLKNQFRATKVVETRKGTKGDTFIVKCYYGSSTMTVEEMNLLIDTIFDRLAEMGVSDTYQADIDYRFMEWNKK